MQTTLAVAPIIETPEVDPFGYDHIIVAFSGGKDSEACFLHLLDLGVPLEKIELWHHDVDGREGSTLMDWPITRGYCEEFARAFGVKIYYSWKQGGFEGEMLRHNSLTASTCFETPDGVKASGGVRGTPSTRRKFPQVAASLTVRWCSAYLKIDICAMAIPGQARFNGKKVLVVSGERAEESAARACYASIEPHRTHGKKRHVDQWRPVHQWSESQVWEIIERYSVNPHPCYRLGWGRCSCSACIFGSKDQWATLNHIAPAQVSKIAAYEQEFGCTINRTKSVPELVSAGRPYPDMAPDVIRQAMAEVFTEPIIVSVWTLPKGAYGESCGPI